MAKRPLKHGFGALLGLVASLACRGPVKDVEPTVSAQFGVFFGGQVQRLQRIALQPDTARQRQGFVLRRNPSDSLGHSVAWEITTAPENATHLDSWGARQPLRSVLYGSEQWPARADTFEKMLRFRPQDPLGRWTVQVTVDQHVVLDTAFTLFRPPGH